MGIEVSEEKLEKAYDKRVKDYFLKNGLKTTENFIELVKKGEEFYPALNSQDDILTFLRNSDEVRNVLVPQVEAKGIGKIENVREGIVKGIVQEHNVDELLLLDEDELKQAYPIVSRIMDKMNERSELKKILTSINKDNKKINE